MPIDKRPIEGYMTPLPFAIGADQSLSSAKERMFTLGVRHLPVLDGGALVGVISARDIAFVCALRSIDPDKAAVEEAMTAEPFAVGPQMPLGLVARSMAERKVGSALVVDEGKVIGILTSTDALSLLANFLLNQSEAVPGPLPSSVRKRILEEHEAIREILQRASDAAEQVLGGESASAPILAETSHELYRTLLRHLDLEDMILAPALRETDSFGPVRAERLTEEHVKQRRQLRDALSSLETDGIEQLAQSIQQLVRTVRKDMEHEEKDLLNKSLLADDPIRVDFSG